MSCLRFNAERNVIIRKARQVINRDSLGISLVRTNRALFSPEVQAGCCFRMGLVLLDQKVLVVWV